MRPIHPPKNNKSNTMQTCKPTLPRQLHSNNKTAGTVIYLESKNDRYGMRNVQTIEFDSNRQLAK